MKTKAWSQDWPAAENLVISISATNWPNEPDNRVQSQIENFLKSILTSPFRISGSDTEDGRRVFCVESL